ncbi:MAG TPA: glycosyl hydrolase family 28-related protein [Gemmatimonadaceae bacterium]|jgi:hypothetical protein
MRNRFAAFAAVLALSCPALATLTTTTNSASYVGNGSTTAFTVPFKFLVNADLVVTVAGVTKALGSDYSVKGAGAATGTVTFTVAPLASAPVVITRAVPLTQTTSLRQSRAFDPATLENGLDRRAMAEQQIANTHAVDKTTQATKDAAQDATDSSIQATDTSQNAQIVGITNSIAGFSSASHGVTDTSSVQALGSSTPRTLTARFADVVNVKDQGAAGDGVANDTTAIQSAATLAAGKTLLFQSGTYKLTGHINISSGTRVIAQGTVTMNQTTAGELVFYGSAVSNIEIRGFTMTGTANATQPLVGTGNNCGAICFETSGGGIVVEKNVISGFWNGITGTNLTGFTVRDNEVSHWRLYAVLASQSADFHIDNNRLHDNDMPTAAAWSSATTYSPGQTATANGLLWMSLQGSNLNNAPPGAPPGNSFWLQIATYGAMASGNRGTVSQFRNTITNNKILNNPVWDGIMSHDCDGLLIANNDIRGVRIGIDLSSSAAGKYDEKIVITGNYLESTVTDAWSGLAARTAGIILFGNDSTIKARNASIVGNVTKGFNGFNAGSTASGAVALSNTEGITVTGNQFTGVSNFAGNVGACIIANGLANGLAISGNSCDGAAGLAGVRIHAATADTISVTGNALRDADGTGIAVNVTSSSTITALAVTGNTSNATTPYAVSGTITREMVDSFATSSTAKKSATYITAAGGTGSDLDMEVAPSSGLTNTDLVVMDLSSTASASASVTVEVIGQQYGGNGNPPLGGLVTWTMTVYGARNAAAAAAWTPTTATDMTVSSTTYGSITAPKLIINTATNVGTLQFQPQQGFCSYRIRARAQSWRGTALAK